MKTKVFLGLSVCCVMFFLGGLFMSKMGDAQATARPLSYPVPGWPASVTFDEDPQEHSRASSFGLL